MAKIKVKLTEDHIKLIKAMRPLRFDDESVGVNPHDLYGGTYIYEDMARALDMMDKAIEGTEERPEGVLFDDETYKYLNSLDEYLMDNLLNIQEIMHQFADEGLQTNVTYVCKDYQHIWHKETI